MPWFCYVEITNMSESIQHQGKIEKIENGIIYVRIIQQSACSGCHAKGMCSASDMKVKTVEIPDSSGLYHVGEEVEICGKASLGMQAVGIAFVVPLVLMVLAIAVSTNLSWSDSVSSLLALIVLVVYYIVLYSLRGKLKRQFIFTLKKLN